MKTTEQVKTPPNPTGKGGFKDNPQNRSPGGWDKTQSISYQYNFLMRLPYDELKNFKPETVAQKIALQRVKNAITNQGLYDTKEITDRTEGKAPQSMDVTTAGNPLSLPTVRIIDERQRDTDTSGTS